MRETANPYLVRLYERHRKGIKKTARKMRVSEAEVVRRAIEAFCI